jgi:hypothetical protein
VVATTDPGKLPGHSTWYLLTDLPRLTGRRTQAAELAEVVRLYGLRNRVEPGYKQVKGELGWADFQVPLDRGDPPTWALVCCVFRSSGRHCSPSSLPSPPRPTPRTPRRPATGIRRSWVMSVSSEGNPYGGERPARVMGVLAEGGGEVDRPGAAEHADGKVAPGRR